MGHHDHDGHHHDHNDHHDDDDDVLGEGDEEFEHDPEEDEDFGPEANDGVVDIDGDRELGAPAKKTMFVKSTADIENDLNDVLKNLKDMKMAKSSIEKQATFAKAEEEDLLIRDASDTLLRRAARREL